MATIPTSPGLDRSDLLRGLAAGLVGGVVASAAMNTFQSAVTPLLQKAQRANDDGGQGSQGDADSSEPATVRLAEVVSSSLLGHCLRDDEKDAAGEAVHYATGAALGGLYGLAAALEPRVTAGAGMAYGVAVAAVLDEAIVPALRLSGPPWRSPLSIHAYSLASHLVFGLTLEVVRRGALSVLNAAGSRKPRGR